MKSSVIIIAVVVMSFAASCTQRTCPTYTKGIKDAPQEQQEVAKEVEKV